MNIPNFSSEDVTFINKYDGASIDYDGKLWDVYSLSPRSKGLYIIPSWSKDMSSMRYILEKEIGAVF